MDRVADLGLITVLLTESALEFAVFLILLNQ